LEASDGGVDFQINEGAAGEHDVESGEEGLVVDYVAAFAFDQSFDKLYVFVACVVCELYRVSVETILICIVGGRHYVDPHKGSPCWGGAGGGGGG
jgi:hypothetical protein